MSTGVVMRDPTGILREGWRRVWERQAALWWLFAGNLALAWLGTVPFSARVGQVTDHSLHAQRLVSGFDFGAYHELASNPDVAWGARGAESMLSVLVFFVFTLFLTGGILTAYSNDCKLSIGQFFEACGECFWRWVRLLIWMLGVLVPVVILNSAVLPWCGRKIFEGTGPEGTGYWIGGATLLVTMFVMMILRLWFDLAQVRAVIENERAMWRNCWKAAKLIRMNFASLFWLYFRISLFSWLLAAAGLWLWAHIPGRLSRLSFLVLETVLFWWLFARLWQRAAEVVWYQRRVVSQQGFAASTPISEAVALPTNPFPANS